MNKGDIAFIIIISNLFYIPFTILANWGIYEFIKDNYNKKERARRHLLQILLAPFSIPIVIFYVILIGIKGGIRGIRDLWRQAFPPFPIPDPPYTPKLEPDVEHHIGPLR